MMHANQEAMQEKIKVLFELWNNRDKQTYDYKTHQEP